MKNKKTLVILVAIVIGIVSTFSNCGDANNGNTVETKQLNISILLDLSDRIDPNTNPATPSHKDRDIAIIDNIVDHFKIDIKNKTKMKFNGKINVFFYPQPQNNPDINSIAEKFNKNCSEMKSPEKQKLYDGISEEYHNNLEQLYDLAIKNGAPWNGSDIWRFFKDDVVNYCIEKDTNYCNVLVILTDGYIYHKNSVGKNGSRVQNLLPNNIAKYRSSNGANTAQMEKDDFGLETKRNDLQNLNVLVLGINPEAGSQTCDYDILRYCIGKWFKEMNVGNFTQNLSMDKYPIYKTDLPANTKKLIDEFFKNLNIE